MKPENVDIIDSQLTKIGFTEKERRQVIDKLIWDTSQNPPQLENLSERFLVYRKNHDKSTAFPKSLNFPVS